MRVRFAQAFAVLVAALLLVPASGGAATRIGSGCIATGGSGTEAFFQTASATSSYAVPNDGAIVSWGSVQSLSTFPSTLLVATPLGGNQFRIDAVSDPQTMAPIGINSAVAHIPVKAGQVIGMYAFGLYCTDAGSTAGKATVSSTTPGTVLTASTPQPSAKVAVFADIEPDADKDGYGDETQDKCPQTASYQAACPTPKLAALLLSSTKSFRAVVTTDLPTTVIANAAVKLPATAAAKTLTFKSKRYQTFPGVATTVKLSYPRSLKNALKSISRRTTVKLTVKLVADGILTDPTKTFTVKLRGTK